MGESDSRVGEGSRAPGQAPDDAVPEGILGDVTMHDRMANVIAHLDPHGAPLPLFVARTEALP